MGSGPDTQTAPTGDGEQATPQPGDVIQGRSYRYRLLRRLGKGGFGSVFLAQCLDAGRGADAPGEQVAVKVLRPAQVPHVQSTLKRELAALLTIQNDRLPRVYDWNIEDDPRFVTLQYFPAGSLADAWPLVGRFDEEQTWRLLSDLLGALMAAHRSSILHLDVKPSNVLLDGDGGFVLTDFGVAQASRMTLGQMQQGYFLIGAGTHGYRAPEQGNPHEADYDLRTDLWGVGATAWAVFTGIDLNKRPETRRREAGNIYGLPRLSDVRLHCPPALEEVIMELLHIDPERRPGGAAEVLARIRAIAEGFGLDSGTVAAASRAIFTEGEAEQVIASLVDPLWSALCRGKGFSRYVVKFEDEVICRGGSQTHHTYVLLRGRIRVEKDGELLDIESQEGTFLGAVSTLTGAPQEVTLRAEGPVWTCIFNEAELEQLVTCNPAVAVRMIRSLASRVAGAPPRS